MTKLSGLPEDTAPTTDDYVVSVDVTSGTTKKVKWLNLGSLFSSAILPLVYPVGGLYIETTGTNPATTFGFGTWTRYAKGQALVGVADSGTFATAGTPLGAETVALTGAQNGPHQHTGGTSYNGDHTHGLDFFGDSIVRTSGGGTQRTYLSGGTGQQLQWGGIGMFTAGGHTHSFTTDSSGSGTAHNNIQPSIPVYVWTRTA